MDRRKVCEIEGGSLRSEEGFNASKGVQSHWKRVLTKFQVNLVIPKNNTYGYISTKGGDMYLWGILSYL